MLTKYLNWLVLGLVSIVVAWYWVAHVPNPGKVGGVTTVNPYRIGVAVALTGPGAFIGESYKAGLEIAKQEINSSGGVAGKPLELFYEDNLNTPQGGVSAFKALNLKHPDIIFTTMSAASVPLSPLARDAGYPLFASAVFADILTDNPLAVNFFARPEDDARVSVKDMQQNGVKEVGVIYLNSEYGKASLDSFKQVSKERGIAIVAMEAFNSDVKDYPTAVAKLASLKPDAVYVIAVATTPVVEAIKQLTNLPIYTNLIPVFGGLPGQSPKIYEGVHVVASAVALPGTGEYNIWQHKLRENTNNLGLGYSAVGYDSLYVIAEAVKRNPQLSELTQTLSSLGELHRVNGTVNFSGRAIGVPLYAGIIRDGKVVSE